MKMSMMKKTTKMIEFRTARKAWVAGRADPTAVVEWTITIGYWLRIELICSWGVEARTRLWGRNFWSYDARWAKRLYGWLEDQWEDEQREFMDPMGRMSDYE